MRNVKYDFLGKFMTQKPSPPATEQERLDRQLYEAANAGEAKAVRSLLAAGANPKARPYGTTALIWAAKGGWVDCVLELAPLSDIDFVDTDGQCALEEARWYPQIVEILEQEKARK